MTEELRIVYCPGCGKVFQKNLRNLCTVCSAEEDRLLHTTERMLLRNRMYSTADIAAAADIPAEKIRSWIRNGKLRIADYPNITDQCDLCRAPIRAGRICQSCAKRIKDDLDRTMERERAMKERLRAANSYISKI